MKKKIKILIVDDSDIFRKLMRKALAAEKDIEITGAVDNGTQVMNAIKTSRPDLITLDVEMPEMDGLETLDIIQRYNRQHPNQRAIGVIMVSALTRTGADVTVKALENGAFDFITKPQEENVGESIAALRRSLIVKIRHFSVMSMGKRVGKRVRQEVSMSRGKGAAKTKRVSRKLPDRIRAVLIGVSTGGPKALAEILPKLSETVDLPVFIVQHMPPGFTASVAKNLDSQCTHRVAEAADGEAVEDRRIYIAPGGKHMMLREKGYNDKRVITGDGPLENGFRPSVDVLFRSAASVYGGDVIAIIMTGMGSDGTKGLGALKRAGAYTIAQDEASSVVWGMPGNAVEAGYIDEVLPLSEIPGAVSRLAEKSLEKYK